jgi:pSer/pThr/pTyr-binding forkhead associated (FHA) protein
MVAAIRLTVLTGPHRDRKFCFCGPTRCLVGRALDCFVRLSGTERDQLISRHHCQLDIDPPCMLVQDLGSRNGTYINGQKVDGVDRRALPNPDSYLTLVKDGDLLTLGGTTLKVNFLDCPHAQSDQEGKPYWDHGETAKSDCRLEC